MTGSKAALIPLFFLSSLAAQPLTWEARRIEEKLPACDLGRENSARAEFEYIEITNGPLDVQNKINQAIRTYLVTRPGDGLALTPAEYARHFVGEFQPGPLATNWYLTKTVKVLHSTPPIFSLECLESGFTGGAHGYADTVYLNFSTSTGEPVKIEALLKEGAMPRLTELGEASFRQAWEVPDGQDLTCLSQLRGLAADKSF